MEKITIEKTPAEAVVLTGKAIADILNYIESLNSNANRWANDGGGWMQDHAVTNKITALILTEAVKLWTAKNDWWDVRFDKNQTFTFVKEQKQEEVNNG
jgi:hypothetical protein